MQRLRGNANNPKKRHDGRKLAQISIKHVQSLSSLFNKCHITQMVSSKYLGHDVRDVVTAVFQRILIGLELQRKGNKLCLRWVTSFGHTGERGRSKICCFFQVALIRRKRYKFKREICKTVFPTENRHKVHKF